MAETRGEIAVLKAPSVRFYPLATIGSAGVRCDIPGVRSASLDWGSGQGALLTFRAPATAVPVSGLRLELEINPTSGEVPCDVTLERLRLHSGESVP
jgi:hypothetical protein